MAAPTPTTVFASMHARILFTMIKRAILTCSLLTPAAVDRAVDITLPILFYGLPDSAS